MDKLNLFIPITKVDVEKRLVYGQITAQEPDEAGEMLDYESTVPFYKDWSAEFEKNTDGKSVGNLRAMHQPIAAGKLTSISFDDAAKRIECCGKVVDDAEWNKVLEGVYTGFSQGGKYVRKWNEPGDPKGVTRYTAAPIEVSLVDSPCLKSSTFEVVKADGTTEVRKFKAAPAGDPDPQAAAGAEFIPSTRNPEPGLEQVWKAKDGSTFVTKDEARAHNVAIEADLLAKNASAAPAAALDALSAALDAKTGPKVEEPKPEVEPVVKVAVTPVEALAKGLYTVCSMANLLSDVRYLVTNYTSEQFYEGDTAAGPLIAELNAWLGTGAELLVRITEMETQELREKGEDENIVVIEACREGDFGKAMELAKGELLEALRKAGARNSKADAERIQKMHDLSKALGADCGKAAGDDDASKAANSADLIKTAAERDAYQKALNDLTPKIEELTKRVNDLARQPAAGGPVLRPQAVSKAQDANGGDEPAPQGEDAVLKQLQAMSSDQIALLLTKASLRKPMNTLPDPHGRHA